MAQIKTNLQYGVTGTVQSANIANDAIDSQHYADGSLDTAHIADDQITLAKMAAGTDGNIITYDASGNPAVVAVGTSGHFLKSQGAGSVPVFAAAGGGITMAQSWRLTSDFSGDATPIASNLEAADTDGAGSIGSSMTESSGIFTYPATGIYFVTFTLYCNKDGDSRYNQAVIENTTDNSSYSEASKVGCLIQSTESSNGHSSAVASILFDVTNTSTHKTRFTVSVSDNSVTTMSDTNANLTHMIFIRLGDT